MDLITSVTINGHWMNLRPPCVVPHSVERNSRLLCTRTLEGCIYLIEDDETRDHVTNRFVNIS